VKQCKTPNEARTRLNIPVACDSHQERQVVLTITHTVNSFPFQFKKLQKTAA